MIAGQGFVLLVVEKFSEGRFLLRAALQYQEHALHGECGRGSAQVELRTRQGIGVPWRTVSCASSISCVINGDGVVSAACCWALDCNTGDSVQKRLSAIRVSVNRRVGAEEERAFMRHLYVGERLERTIETGREGGRYSPGGNVFISSLGELQHLNLSPSNIDVRASIFEY